MEATVKLVKILPRLKSDLASIEARADLDIKYYVPASIVCDELSYYEYGVPANVYEKYDSVVEYYEKLTGNNGDGDNTYNHGGHIFNDMNWTIFEFEGKYHIIIMFHLGGDIRGNYTDEAVCEFDSISEFYELISDISTNNGLSFDMKVDGKNYVITPYVLDEELDVWRESDDEQIVRVFGTDDETVIEQIRENS